MTPPTPSSPLLRAMRGRSFPAFHRACQDAREDAASTGPKLSDYPDLAMAATATKAELDTTCETFHAVHGCLETLCRLDLSKRAALALLVLARHGPLTLNVLAANVRASQANTSQIIRRLEGLGLLTKSQQGPDLRHVYATITEAGTKVLASLVALTGLAGASSVMLQTRTR